MSADLSPSAPDPAIGGTGEGLLGERAARAGRSTPLQRLGVAAVAVWAAGAQLNEGIATVGLAATALWSTVDAARVLRADAEARTAADRWLRSFWPVALWVAWALAASLLGNGARGAGIARTVDWLALPFAAWALARVGAGGRRTVLTVALLVLVLSSASAGLQHFGIWPAPESFEPLRWTKVGFNRVYEPIPGAENRFMAGGLLFHRLKFAHVGGLAVLTALVVGLRSSGRARWGCLGAAALGALCILAFPYARAASAALVATAALTVVLVHPRRRLAFVLAGAVVVVALATVALRPSLRDRFLRGATASGSGDRDQILASGLRAVREHPWVGTGVGRFRPSAFAEPGMPRHVLDNPGKAHNQLLSIAAETGIVGVSLFVLMLMWLARVLRGAGAPGWAGLAGLIFFVVLGLTHDPLFQAEFSIALALALGAGLSETVPARFRPACAEA